MGGDEAPGEILAGARRAFDELGIDVVVVGPDGLDTLGLPRIAASEVIGMGEDPAGGVRRKKDATLVRAAEAVRDGKAAGDGFGGQHGRRDGVGTASHGTHPWRQPAGHRHRHPGPRHLQGHGAPRRRRQRRVPAGVAGAVRADGHGLRPAPLRARPATRRPPLDRRGEHQGQLAGQGRPTRCWSARRASRSSATSRVGTS